MFQKIFLCILTYTISILADLPDKIREFFEWGEYSALIDTLAPRIDSLSEVSDSSITAYYHSCLGVAFFSLENTSHARSHFLKALQFDTSISIPSEYVSHEITALFKVIKSEFEKQRRLNFIQDSLTNVQNFEKELLHKNALTAEIKKKHQRFLVASISSSTAGAAFIGLSIFYYGMSKSHFSDFKRAASSGDQFQYDKLKGKLNRANGFIISLDITSGVAFCCGIVTAIKAHHVKKDLYELR